MIQAPLLPIWEVSKENLFVHIFCKQWGALTPPACAPPSLAARTYEYCSWVKNASVRMIFASLVLTTLADYKFYGEVMSA